MITEGPRFPEHIQLLAKDDSEGINVREILADALTEIGLLGTANHYLGTYHRPGKSLDENIRCSINKVIVLGDFTKLGTTELYDEIIQYLDKQKNQ